MTQEELGNKIDLLMIHRVDDGSFAKEMLKLINQHTKEYVMSLCYVHQQNPFIDSGTDGHRDLDCPICREYENNND